MKYTRRQFGAALAAGVTLSPSLRAAAINSKVGGVRLGVQTFSFHEVRHGSIESIDKIIADMTSVGLGMCELYSPDLEPGVLPSYAYQPWAKFDAQDPVAPSELTRAATQKQRADLRTWRLTTPLSYFSGIGKKFSSAGIQIFAFNLSFDESFTDEEIDRGFDMAKALGAGLITSSATLGILKRLAPIAEKHQMYVAMHGHDNVKDTNHFSTPESFATALETSKYFKVNLDMGHFWVAGFDPVAYIEKEHANITNIHIKDRLRSTGEDLPWGQEGPDHAPLREVLLLLKKNRWPIPAMIEYEYHGPSSSRVEVANCYAYAKKILEG